MSPRTLQLLKFELATLKARIKERDPHGLGCSNNLASIDDLIENAIEEAKADELNFDALMSHIESIILAPHVLEAIAKGASDK